MKWFVLLAGLAVAGCSASATATPPNTAPPPPVGYREAVVAEVKNTFFDPYSVRDAEISQPLYATALFDGSNIVPKQSWIVCIKANAKNRMGGYTGRELVVMSIAGNKVTSALSGRDMQMQLAAHCKEAVWEPFPEIEMTAATPA